MRLLSVVLLALSISRVAIAGAASVQGQLRSQTDYFPIDLGSPTDLIVPRVGIELDAEQKMTKSFRYSFKGTFDSNLVSKYQPEQYFGDLKEAYLELKKSVFKYRLGWNTVNWGVLDAFSPMDVVNQRVYFDPLNPTKRGAPMLEIQANPPGWSFTALYIPWQAKAMLPSADSRWYPRNQLNDVQFAGNTIILPQQVQYDIRSTYQFDNALENNFGFNLEKQWDWLDLHADYFNGAAQMPDFNVADGNTFIATDLGPGCGKNFTNCTVLAVNPLALTPFYYRTETTGFGFSATTGSLIVRGETAYTNTISAARDYDFPSWSWQSGLGLEKNWEVFSHTLTQVLYYFRGIFPQDSSNLPTSGFRLFDDAAMTGARYALTDDRFVYGSVLYNFPQQGVFGMVGFQTKLIDSVRWDISWRQFAARRDGLLKTYDRNSHAAMELVYFF